MKTMNLKYQRAGRLAVSLSLFLSLLLLSACLPKAGREEATTQAFQFSTQAEEAGTTPASVSPTAEAPMPALGTVPENSSATALAMPEPQRQIPSQEADGGMTDSQEPAVPLSQPSEHSIRGIAGHKVERFLKTLSTTPVYYHYNLYPGKESGESPSEILLALSTGESYMRIDRDGASQAVMQNSPSYYYFLDLNAHTYEIIRGNSSSNNELSMDAFRELEKNSQFLICTGEGGAVFMGRQVRFEEYTMDGERYVRYYFVGDALVGHRSFEAGKIVESIQVLEVSNRYDDNLFILPDSLKQVQSGQLPQDVEEESAKKKGP